MNEPRLLVLGLDGASWSFLEPWIEEGLLPNLRRMRDGAAGDLVSCLPPVTSPNWKCFSTGKHPGNLGVYWWETLDWSKRRIRTPQSTDFRGAELWEYLADAGLRSLVVNMPTTYPPSSFDGVLIAGGPATGETGFTHPPELEDRLLASHNYRAIPESIDLIRHEPEHVVEEIRRLMRLRFTVAEELMRRESFDYVQVTLFLINVLQHHFGHGDPVRQAWEWIDDRIGRWRDRFSNVPMVLVSDHGCNEIDYKFNINRWLVQEGHLVVEQPADQALMESLGLNRDRVARWVTRLGLKPLLKRLLPETVRNWLPTADQAVRTAGKSRLIGWDRSRAYAFGQGPIFLNPDQSPDQRKRLQSRLVEELSELSGPGPHSVAREVVDGREYYGPEARGTRPDLVIDQQSGVHISGSLGFDRLFERPSQWKAENARMGVYAWDAPAGVHRTDPGEPVHITDLMPSLLAWLTGEVPADVDGAVRFRSSADAPHRERDPLGGTPEERRQTDEQTRERLEGLGYLD